MTRITRLWIMKVTRIILRQHLVVF